MIGSFVSNAVRAGRPRTRYVAGAFAKPMIFIRKWFADRLFGRMTMSQVK